VTGTAVSAGWIRRIRRGTGRAACAAEAAPVTPGIDLGVVLDDQSRIERDADERSGTTGQSSGDIPVGDEFADGPRVGGPGVGGAGVGGSGRLEGSESADDSHELVHVPQDLDDFVEGRTDLPGGSVHRPMELHSGPATLKAAADNKATRPFTRSGPRVRRTTPSPCRTRRRSPTASPTPPPDPGPPQRGGRPTGTHRPTPCHGTATTPGAFPVSSRTPRNGRKPGQTSRRWPWRGEPPRRNLDKRSAGSPMETRWQPDITGPPSAIRWG
jgi:hypothetical protein